jgi:hypothetical protein
MGERQKKTQTTMVTVLRDRRGNQRSVADLVSRRREMAQVQYSKLPDDGDRYYADG